MAKSSNQPPPPPPPPQPPATDAQVSEDFTRYYMQRVTEEFAEDLDAMRTADDFQDSAFPLLVHALQQGTSMFSIADKRRVVAAGTAGKEREREKEKEMEKEKEKERPRRK